MNVSRKKITAQNSTLSSPTASMTALAEAVRITPVIVCTHTYVSMSAAIRPMVVLIVVARDEEPAAFSTFAPMRLRPASMKPK